MSSELVRYDAMCQAIAAAYDIDEVKQIRDKAVALEHYARIALDEEQERRCRHIRLRAERKAGELLKATPLSVGGRPRKNPSDETRGFPNLADYGISYDQSSAWQKLADVDEGPFEQALAADEAGESAALNQIIINTKARRSPPIPVSVEALRIWGRLRDYERDGLFARDPIQMMSTATPEMRADVLRLVPLVCEWLYQLVDIEWDVIYRGEKDGENN